jgi:hypothetical protein
MRLPSALALATAFSVALASSCAAGGSSPLAGSTTSAPGIASASSARMSAVSSAAPATPSVPTPPAGACPKCAPATTLTTVDEPDLTEVSGIVASRDHAGIFYVHNDSGDTARFFAIDEHGADQGTFRVTNAQAIDWEDIARGPCADSRKSCLYLGDIGDNKSVRTEYTLYRLEEPAALGPGDHEVTAEILPFTYPDDAHNAEALLVHPTTGEVTIVTKSLLGSEAYTFPTPLTPGTKAKLVRAGAVTLPEILGLVTAGDVKPDGSAILLRTYAFAYFYPVPAGASLADSLVNTPCMLPVTPEPQGEGIAWLTSGKGYVMASEGKKQPLHEVLCP